MGSKIKADLKKEKFALKFWETMNGRESAIYAGVKKGPGLDTSVSRLLSDAKVQKILAGLKARQETLTIVTKEKLIDEWSRVAFADPADVMSWNESGIEMIPKDKLMPEKRRLIKSLSHHTTATGESFKVELVDRDSAKKELAKLMGWYPEEGTGEQTQKVTFIIQE